MPAQPLSTEQKNDAQRLKTAWNAFKKSRIDASQEKLAAECGWKTQGTVSQYILGKIPLNLPALIKFSKALEVKPEEISPTLAAQLPKESQGSASNQPPALVDTSPTAINNIASIEQLMAGLSDYLVQMDDYARDNAADVLRRLTAKPEEHARAAALFATAFQSGKRRAA